jgi:hypothetical protein
MLDVSLEAFKDRILSNLFLNSLDMRTSRHHSLRILKHVTITGFSERQFNQTSRAQSKKSNKNSTTFVSASHEFLASVVTNSRRWLQMTLDADGADTENIFLRLSF